MSRLLEVSLLVLYCSLVVFIPLSVDASDRIVFSAGAPLGSFQGKVIAPLLEEAFKRNGFEFKAVYHPSLRSLSLSNSGIMDGELHRVYEFHHITEGEYPNLIRIESKLLSIWLAVFSVNGKKIDKIEDLKENTVVYYRGRKNVEKLLQEVLPRHFISQSVTDKQAFLMLAGGRVDFVISESREGNAIIAGDPIFSEIKESAKLQETRIYAYINKKYDYLAPQLASTLEEMKHDGTYSEIYNRVVSGQD